MAGSATCCSHPGPPHTMKTSQSGQASKPAWATIDRPPASSTRPGRAAIVTAEMPGNTRRAMEITPTVPPMSMGSTP